MSRGLCPRPRGVDLRADSRARARVAGSSTSRQPAWGVGTQNPDLGRTGHFGPRLVGLNVDRPCSSKESSEFAGIDPRGRTLLQELRLLSEQVRSIALLKYLLRAGFSVTERRELFAVGVHVTLLNQEAFEHLVLLHGLSVGNAVGQVMTSTPRANGDSALVAYIVPFRTAVTASAMPSFPTTSTLPCKPRARRAAMHGQCDQGELGREDSSTVHLVSRNTRYPSTPVG